MIQIPDNIRELVSLMVASLAKYLAGPDCGDGAAGHMLDEEVGDAVIQLASVERVDGDGFLSWSICERLNTIIEDSLV